MKPKVHILELQSNLHPSFKAIGVLSAALTWLEKEKRKK